MKQSPENRILLAAQLGALLVLILFISDSFINKARDLQAGQERVQQFNGMMAEHTARTFEAVEILLREMTGDLSKNQPEWPRWNSDEGWSYLAKRHSRAMPQLRALYIYDNSGEQRHLSISPPGQSGKIRNEMLAAEFASGKKIIRAGPYLEESSKHFTYALAQRIDGPAGNFIGFTAATIEPVYLQDFCWPNRLSEDFEAVLINRNGQIIAACRPSDTGRQASLLGKHSEEALFDGQLRSLLPASGTVIRNDFIIALTPVPGFPELSILTVAPQRSLLAPWYNRLIELSILALLIITIILAGGFLMRRQLKKVSSMTEQLAASHNELERRIAAATTELAKQRDNAELANLAKSRFLAAASHDLRQPMHALSLFATDLQAQARSGTYRELPRLAEQIGSSTQLLSELLDSLLDISRLDVAGINPDIRCFPLQPIFDRIAGACRRTAIEHELLLRFRFTRLWLESDPSMIERMIANLVSNAIRYTPRGGRVLIAARQRGERVLIEIRDSGIGIAPENQGAVFTEFFQVGNAAREHHQGLGLGLSIVERLAQALKVDIGLRSALNRGTLFTLTVAGSPPQPIENISPRAENDAPTLHFFGDGDDIEKAMQLASLWGYTTLRHADLSRPLPPGSPQWVLTEEHLALAVRQLCAGDLTLIVLVNAGNSAPHALPEGCRPLALPIRPAKLRALLAQLQNTSSKSIP